MTQKAVILARGLGTRMRRARPDVELGPEQRRLAAHGAKAMMPLGGRPFIDYVADSLLRAGMRRICLVVAPDADDVREHVARIRQAAGATIECAVQDEPLGTADAVLAAEAFVGDDCFVLVNGDNLYPDDALRRLAELEDGDCYLAAFEAGALARDGNIGAERVKDFAAVVASEAGELLSIEEKPAEPGRYEVAGELWVSMNLYRFTPAIFDRCRRIEPDPTRGELELTAAVAAMLNERQRRFHVVFCRGGVFDLTGRGDIPAAEAALGRRRLCF